jgi:hypothetical protein
VVVRFDRRVVWNSLDLQIDVTSGHCLLRCVEFIRTNKKGLVKVPRIDCRGRAHISLMGPSSYGLPAARPGRGFESIVSVNVGPFLPVRLELSGPSSFTFSFVIVRRHATHACAWNGSD